MARRERDAYQTPLAFAQQIVDRLDWADVGTVMDPCAGEGNIIRALRSRVPESTMIYANDINRAHEVDMKEAGADDVWLQDMFHLYVHVDVIITNFPYSRLEECFQYFWPMAKQRLVMLVPVNWLFSRRRYGTLHAHTLPIREWRLPCRPSFTGNGNSDRIDYVWMEYGPEGYQGEVEVNYLEPIGRGGRVDRS